MTTIEEQVWDYIDGNGDAAYRLETEKKIAAEPAYSSVYKELMALQQQLLEISLDEPSMSFSRNVMERLSHEAAPVSLKTKTDNRIILAIASFFILAIAAIFIYAISKSHVSAPKIHLTIDMERYLTPTLIKIFLFIDIVIGFLYVDRLLHKKRL